MISLAEVNSAAGRFKVPAETIEKDYVICWILASLSKSGLKEDFIFYGGTAIKRIYFEDHRYSEDIDLLTAKIFNRGDLARKLAAAVRYAGEKTNLALGIDSDRILTDGSRTQIVVTYSGFDEIMGAPKEIRLDFAMGMEPYGTISKGKIVESYSDLKNENAVFSVQTLNTILAGKLGLLIDTVRKEPRDLYDVWFLLSRLDQFNFDLSEVRKTFMQKYGYFPSLGVLGPPLGHRFYRERWETRLRKQVADLPGIEAVTAEVNRQFKKLFGEDAVSHS